MADRGEKEMMVMRELEGTTAIVTLNRPERRNALSLEMMRELYSAFEDIGRDAQIRAVILAAAGPVFSAGHDLGEMTGRCLEDYREIFDACTCLMEKIQQIPQPVIAEVQGIATAAGCQLAATCDLVIASGRARFGTPGVKIGLFCSTPMVALTRAIGRKRAMEMLLTGELIDARKAAEWGLVNRVVSAPALRTETLRLANKIAEASASTISTGKQAFYKQIDLDQSAAYAYAKEVMAQNNMHPDAQEGITAFVEKRPRPSNCSTVGRGSG